MKLFTSAIDKQLFAQYSKGNDLSAQKVVAKIFNPYGSGTWYLLNSDENDPDYIWAIVDLIDIEIGSISRSELESIKVPPFRLSLERDTSFTPINAMELYKGLKEGKHYKDGGVTTYKSDLQLVEDDKTKSYYLFPNPSDKDSMGIKFKDGGEFGVDKHKVYFSSLAEVIEAIYDIAEDNGYNVVDIFPDLTYGGISYGQTKKVKVELEWNGKEKRGKSKKRDNNVMNVSIYRMDSGNYELNTYFAYADGGYMAKGAELEEGVDLFEDYENIPNDVQEILDNHQEAFEDGDYRGLKMAHDELSKIGYTFEYYLDGQAYDLRKIGQKGKSEIMDNDDYANGGYMAKGGVTFAEKVDSVKASLLKRKKVASSVQKDYGKTYSPKEAEDSAKRIVGSQVAKYKMK